MEYQKRTARVRRIILRAFCIGIILLSVGAVVIVYLVTEVPRHYHPLAPVVREEVHAYLTHYLVPGFYNNIKLDEPFEIIVLQQELNEIIVDENTLGWSWPVCLSGVSISAPQVVFLDASGSVHRGRGDGGSVVSVRAGAMGSRRGGCVAAE